MAYAVQQNRTVAIGSVALVHAALGVALVSGLVVTSWTEPPKRFVATHVPLPVPPKPLDPPPPEIAERVTTPRPPLTPPITVPIPIVDTNTVSPVETTTVTYPPLPPLPPIPEPRSPGVDPIPPVANLSRGLQPRGNQGEWFPRDSYPAAARRANVEGRVSVSVSVGTSGRVTDCRVVASSGNADLDAATCRLAQRNGRFTPALDPSGEAIASTVTLRPVRWTLEE